MDIKTIDTDYKITTDSDSGSPKTVNISDLGNAIDSSQIGAANGVASLDGSGKVPSGELPSYVDDVIEVADFASLPGTGEEGKIYITQDNNKSFRYVSASDTYVEISNPGTDWGDIGGTLSNQTDLQTALDGKVGEILEEDTSNNSIRIKDSITGQAPNTLGDNAIDLQGIRFDPTQTASGTLAIIGNGLNNTASGFQSFVGNGEDNTASGTLAIIGNGIDNTASGQESSVINGEQNTASSLRSSVINGNENTASENYSTVINGLFTKTDNVDEVSAGTTNNSQKENSKLINLPLGATLTGTDTIGKINISDSSVIFGTIHIAGSSLDGANSWGAKIEFTATSDSSGVLAITGNATTVNQADNFSTDNFDIVANNTSGSVGLDVKVTSLTYASAVRWTAALTGSVSKHTT